MPLSIVQITFVSSPLQQSPSYNLNPSTILPKTLFPPFETEPSFIAFKRFIFSSKTSLSTRTKATPSTTTHASLLETPVLWAGRLCIFYALLKAGLAGSPANPLVSDLDIVDSNESGGDLGFSKWTHSILGKPAKEGVNGRKFVSKWHPTTKGTLRRNYRVPSKSEGRRLLKAIASLLSMMITLLTPLLTRVVKSEGKVLMEKVCVATM